MEHGLDGLYTAPRAHAEPTDRARVAASLRKRSAALFGFSLLGLLGSIVIGSLTNPSVALLPLGATVCIALAGAVHAIASITKSRKPLAILGSASLAMMNLSMAAAGAFAAWLSTITFTRGRQMRRLGKILLPPLAAGDAWTKRDIVVVDI